MALKNDIEILRSQLDEMALKSKEHDTKEILHISEKLDKLIERYYEEILYKNIEKEISNL